MNHRHPLLGCLLAALLSTGLATAASTEANLIGKVTDKSGQPLPGATLVLKNDALAFQEHGTLTDSKGEYRFSHLPPGGGYELTVSLSGYSTIIFSDLFMGSGRTQEQSIVLHTASDMKEVVRVQAKSDTLDTEKVTASTTFSSTFISELPILGRDYQDILSLAPGVTDVNNTGNPNIHGARDTDVGTLVDGVSTTDPFTGYFGQNLNIESIQELEVITSAATAQYSRAQGGFANILTKSGSNEFKGAFKFYLRSDRLDGDGAGFEDPELTGGITGTRDYTEQHFTDLMPFLSLSGAIVRDRVWYYVSFEYLQEEIPVNALSEVYVLPVYGNRAFGKTTWQMSPAQKLAFSLIFDKERWENLGVNSLTAEESGYSRSRGGPTYTLKESAVFKPTVLLESTLSWFDNSFSQTPTTNPDTNGNGILFVDNHPEAGGNGNGILEAKERDSGEDWDRDGFYDLWEDVDYDGHADPGEDLDYDGYVSGGYPPTTCEGHHHEDLNCDGWLDAEDDTNLNGRLDPAEDVGIPCYPWGYCPGGYLPGTVNNGKLDTEDKNGNGVLDVVGDSGYTAAPFWNDTNGNGYPDRGEYHAPLPADRDLVRDSSGRISGPGRIEQHDHRKRLSWVEDLSLFAADLAGTHDLRLGFAYEHEGYDNEAFWAPIFTLPTGGFVTRNLQGPARELSNTVTVNLAIPAIVQNSATGDNLGIYLQDSWKPVPNLTLGLGVRFDYERLDSFGYTSFDPAAERRAFNDLMSAAGMDGEPYDGITVTGLCRDPIHSCLGSQDIGLQVLKTQLLGLAFDQFTRHNLDVDVQSLFLGGITGGTNLSGLPGGGLKVRNPEEYEITNSNLAPRLSLSWDPRADGKTMLFSSWGRYYDKIFLHAVTLEQGPDTVSRTYLSDDNAIDGQGFSNHGLLLALAQSPLSAIQVDRSLATPYSDEWTAGFRRELVPEVLVSFRYIHRDYHDQLQDIDINHHTGIEPATGRLADRLGDPTCLRGQDCQNVPNGAPDLYVNNIFLNRVYRLGNFNDQTYRGWEVEFVRRLKRKWQLEASYTYSVAEGDAESYRSEIGNDPALVEFEPGYLSYDQRHVVKFNAVAFLPGDWRLGGTITWASGLPYSAIVHYFDLDDVGYTQSRILYGQLGPQGYGITPENRNLHRNGGSYLINTRVVKSFVIGKSAASAFLEVYNLLNTDTLTVEAIDQVPATFLYGPTGPPTQIHPTSEVVGSRDFGRRFQVGFQVDF